MVLVLDTSRVKTIPITLWGIGWVVQSNEEFYEDAMGSYVTWLSRGVRLESIEQNAFMLCRGWLAPKVTTLKEF